MHGHQFWQLLDLNFTVRAVLARCHGQFGKYHGELGKNNLGNLHPFCYLQAENILELQRKARTQHIAERLSPEDAKKKNTPMIAEVKVSNVSGL